MECEGKYESAIQKYTEKTSNLSCRESVNPFSLRLIVIQIIEKILITTLFFIFQTISLFNYRRAIINMQHLPRSKEMHSRMVSTGFSKICSFKRLILIARQIR